MCLTFKLLNAYEIAVYTMYIFVKTVWGPYDTSVVSADSKYGNNSIVLTILKHFVLDGMNIVNNQRVP